jgi:NarL family two-component system sensor histidine kinase YdfH
LLTGQQDWLFWLLAVGPMTFFVVVYVVLYSRQSEARARALVLLVKLEAANQQLTEYAARVEDLTIANERQRMARELHDTLSQGLAGLILQLEAASAHLESQRIEKAQTVLAQAMAQARGTLADARRAIGDLREAPVEPPPDLAQAVRAEAAQFHKTTGIPCEVDSAVLPNLPENVRETALRMVSECLSNIARHAQAHRAWIRMAAAGKVLYVEAGDDGKGFDISQALNQDGHFGLLGVRERADMARGKLVINSQPGLGTVIRLELPFQ